MQQSQNFFFLRQGRYLRRPAPAPHKTLAFLPSIMPPPVNGDLISIVALNKRLPFQGSSSVLGRVVGHGTGEPKRVVALSRCRG